MFSFSNSRRLNNNGRSSWFTLCLNLWLSFYRSLCRINIALRHTLFSCSFSSCTSHKRRHRSAISRLSSWRHNRYSTRRHLCLTTIHSSSKNLFRFINRHSFCIYLTRIINRCLSSTRSRSWHILLKPFCSILKSI